MINTEERTLTASLCVAAEVVEALVEVVEVS